MTRDETILLWRRCEEARAQAAGAGASIDEAHRAAKAVWNDWAESQLIERKKIEAQGKWDLLKRKGETRKRWFQRHSPVMQSWLLQARADFSGLKIVLDPNHDILSSGGDPFYNIRVGGPWIDFRDFIFPGEADFTEAELSGITYFDQAIFKGPAWFRAVKTNTVNFNNTVFLTQVWFRQAEFSGAGHLGDAVFRDEADFVAINSKSFFDLSETKFEYLPNFIQAHFDEAPRLDDLRVVGRVIPLHPRPQRDAPKSRRQGFWRVLRYAGGCFRTWPMRAARGMWHRLWSADRGAPSRWRALKRLAIQGHDTDSELEFHAREVRAQRFARDWPLPLAFWRRKAWSGFFRFWFGILYEIASDFGRSLVRPAALWLFAATLGAIVYVSQSPATIDARAKERAAGASPVSATLNTAIHAWRGNPKPCYAGEAIPPKDQNGETPAYAGALSPHLKAGTDLANEAWHLAFRNAFILLDSSGEAAHRSYGCLYGVELYGGGNPLAIVPSAVSTASAIQKVFSALTIFLFGLALRNMLKVK
jgi:hypothetical protein